VTDRLCRFGGADLVDAPGNTPILKITGGVTWRSGQQAGRLTPAGVDTVLGPAAIGHELRRQRGL
jgi:hypothetical protein